MADNNFENESGAFPKITTAEELVAALENVPYSAELDELLRLELPLQRGSYRIDPSLIPAEVIEAYNKLLADSGELVTDRRDFTDLNGQWYRRFQLGSKSE